MDFLNVGIIQNTHGLKGELKIKNLSDFNRFTEGSILYISHDSTNIKVEVLKARETQNYYLVVFKGLEDINLVEKYKGDKILISKDDIYSFSMTDSNGILLTFEKQGDTWVYVDDESLDINEDRIDKVLNYLCQVKFINSFQTDSAKDYGLTQESPQYILYDANEYSTLISLGNVDEKTGNVYFALNYDFSTVYVNEGKLNNVREYGIEELLNVR